MGWLLDLVGDGPIAAVTCLLIALLVAASVMHEIGEPPAISVLELGTELGR